MVKSNTASIDQKTSFLASTVHEIRTPVQTIIGTLELLADTPLNKEQTEYVRQIKFSTDVLLSLVNDILDIAKIRSQEFKLESIPFDVATITEQVADLVSIEAFSKGLEIVTDTDASIPPLVMGDPTRVQQILLNIIKNAVKFTKQGYIHIELTRKNNDTLLFEVTDSGIGIPEASRKQLFTDFYQADTSTTRKYGGTGLGLAICKGLVSAMHGQIGVRSNPYGGSIFWFELPLTISLNATQEESMQPVIPAVKHILIVDDNMLALKSMQRKLEAFGLTNVQLCTNAQEALLSLEYAAKIGKPFDIAFIDMSMPGVDGWHLGAEIHDSAQLKGLKTFLLVPEGQMGSEAKMKLLNWFTGYLYKPVKRAKLESLLKDTYSDSFDFETVQGVSVGQDILPENPVNDTTVAAGMTVLVAEDHPMNRRLIVTFLQRYGADVIEAENGKEAVDKIQQNPNINLVFMDIQMPVMNGVDAAIKIRKLNYSGIIIACTANNDEDDFNKYRKIGMNDILVKPFKRASVRAVVEKWKTVMELPGAKEIAVLDSRLAQSSSSWDQNDFEDTINNDNELGRQLIDDYRGQTNALMRHTEQAIEIKDFQELRRIGHTFKGSSAAISANTLAQYGEQLNVAAKAGDIEGVKKAYSDFSEEFAIFELVAGKWKREHE